MRNEHTNRALKAVAISAALRIAGCDAETAEALDDAGWQLAAKVAAANTDGATWTDASWETRSIVIGILGAGEKREDLDARVDFLTDRKGAADPAWQPEAPITEPAPVLTVRAVQSSGGARPGRTDDERALAEAVDQAIARQHHGGDLGPFPEEDDAYINWCAAQGDLDPEDALTRAMYADHLDASEREAMRP